MGTNKYSKPASKSSWDSQYFGDVNMVLKMAHFHKSSRPQWVNKGVTTVLWQTIDKWLYTVCINQQLSPSPE